MSAIKELVKKSIKKIASPFCNRVGEINNFVPPGHYYSPIPGDEDLCSVFGSLEEAASVDSKKLEARNNSAAGLQLNESKQIQLIEEFGAFYKTCPRFPVKKTEEYRFSYDNPYFSYADTTVFCCLVQKFKPRKIIDVGGGVTTTLMMDMNDLFFKNNPMNITLIEPHAENIEHYLKGDQSVERIFKKIQDVDPAVFTSLNAGDILFLDTSHVSKMGSEVNFLVFNVLPLLKPGVIIHIHEIFYPFEYPIEFYNTYKYWNEIYLWRAFIMHNTEYEIILFNSWFARKHTELLRKNLPDYFLTGRQGVIPQCEGSSLWLQKK